MVPAAALGTPAAQQAGNFMVSVAGTAVGSAPHQIDLKMTQLPGGQISEVTGFIVSPEDVVQVNQGENLLVATSPDLIPQQVTLRNLQGQQINLMPLPGGMWSLQGLIPGMYTLDVTADMSSSGILGTYETYLVVLEPGQQPLPPTTVISQITIEYTEVCPGNSTLVNGTCINPPPQSPIFCPTGTPTNRTCIPLPLPNTTIPLPNTTIPLPNTTIPLPNATEPTLPGANATGSTQPGGGGGVNQTIVPQPPLECPKGEQPSPDGLRCEPIGIEEPMPIICSEGEELVDGQCQTIPTDDVGEPELEENGGSEGGDEGGDEGGEDTGDGGNGDGGNGDGGNGDGGNKGDLFG
jgi:hypothetical protein